MENDNSLSSELRPLVTSLFGDLAKELTASLKDEVRKEFTQALNNRAQQSIHEKEDISVEEELNWVADWNFHSPHLESAYKLVKETYKQVKTPHKLDLFESLKGNIYKTWSAEMANLRTMLKAWKLVVKILNSIDEEDRIKVAQCAEDLSIVVLHAFKLMATRRADIVIEGRFGKSVLMDANNMMDDVAIAKKMTVVNQTALLTGLQKVAPNRKFNTLTDKAYGGNKFIKNSKKYNNSRFHKEIKKHNKQETSATEATGQDD